MDDADFIYLCKQSLISMKKFSNTLIPLLSASILMTACGIMGVRTQSSPTMVPEDVTVWTVSGVAFNNADFSGLAFSADGKKMVAAFNSAALYWMEIPRKAGEELVFKPLEVENSGFHKVKRDIECVTLDPRTGDIWYGQERDGEYKGASLYRLRAPRYDKDELVVTFDKETIPDGNQGIEGLTWISDGMYIVGREGGGFRKIDPLMIFYSETKGITDRIVPAKEIKQIAEIVYDEVRDCLWILDGDYDRILYRCDMRGNVLDCYPIPDIANAEALVLDRKRSCIWIGSDEEPSKLYRIGFKNL